jgi:hypothetical protein
MNLLKMNGKALKTILLSGNFIFAGLIFTACNQHPNNTSDNTTVTTADTTAVDSTTAMKADWQKFKQDADHQIADMNDTISSFKMRLKKLHGKMKTRYEHDITVMQEKNDTLKAKLDNFKIESKDKWNDFKDKFNYDMAKLKGYLRDSTAVSEK